MGITRSSKIPYFYWIIFLNLKEKDESGEFAVFFRKWNLLCLFNGEVNVLKCFIFRFIVEFFCIIKLFLLWSFCRIVTFPKTDCVRNLVNCKMFFVLLCVSYVWIKIKGFIISFVKVSFIYIYLPIGITTVELKLC